MEVVGYMQFFLQLLCLFLQYLLTKASTYIRAYYLSESVNRASFLGADFSSLVQETTLWENTVAWEFVFLSVELQHTLSLSFPWKGKRGGSLVMVLTIQWCMRRLMGLVVPGMGTHSMGPPYATAS